MDFGEAQNMLQCVFQKADYFDMDIDSYQMVSFNKCLHKCPVTVYMVKILSFIWSLIVFMNLTIIDNL